MQAIVPRATRVAVLARGGLSSTQLLLIALRTAGQPLGLELTEQLVIKPEDFPAAFTEFDRVGANTLFVQVSPLTVDHRSAIVELAAQHHLPAMYETRPFVEVGGLSAYGPDAVSMLRRAANYVDKIFKGAKPADLPVEQPTKFDLTINLKTAKAMGLAIPEAFLLRADTVIE